MYEIVWDEETKAELRLIGAFRRKITVDAVQEQLRHQPEVATRNRKRLRAPLDELPEATRELRVHGEHRVFYRVSDTQTVTVLRVILKGTETTGDAVRKGETE